MTRIIAGAARGRTLAVPPKGTRPTADRAREALFSAVESLLGGPAELRGAYVLDLYAGSGAVGLEALSRGAAQVTLVESAATAAAVIRANSAVVGLPGVQLLVCSVEAVLAGPPAQPFDLVFADPPYAMTGADVEKALELLRTGWVREGTVVVVERATRVADGLGFAWPPGFDAVRNRSYGEATMWFARATV